MFKNGSQEGKGREEGVIRMMRAMGPGDWIIITPQHLPLYLPNEPYLLLFCHKHSHESTRTKHGNTVFFQAPVQLHVFLLFVNSSSSGLRTLFFLEQFSAVTIEDLNRRSGLNN